MEAVGVGLKQRGWVGSGGDGLEKGGVGLKKVGVVL